MKERIDLIRTWLKNHHIPPRMIFITLGVISTVWFLIRVIPKPSRAAYPCMRAAAPFMSGFVIYLLSLGVIVIALRKTKKYFKLSWYLSATAFFVVALLGILVLLTSDTPDTFASSKASSGPEDGPNQPMGEGRGVNPGHVIWVWNPEATNENCINSFETNDWIWKPSNTNEKVVGTMFQDAVKKLAGKTTITESWNALFQYHNKNKSGTEKGYTKGEKIFIKINQNNSRPILRQGVNNKGNYNYPITLKPEEAFIKDLLGTSETGPYIVLELLSELVNDLGIPQKDIAVGDPIAHIYGYNYDIWHSEFPDVKYIDKGSEDYERTLIHETKNDLVFYSDKTQADKLFDVIENTAYFINVANLKPHSSAGISLTAKNHYGSQSQQGAHHLHNSLVGPFGEDVFTNAGYRKYRALVDLMGSKFLGLNTVLYVVDGLFGGGSNQQFTVVKYFMSPFNNDWSSSVFISQDQVALESVCFDFLRSEWNGINKHNPANNKWEAKPTQTGVDDYLHQAASSKNWPAGIVYDPDNSGSPIPSLGVHEHWNNPIEKMYSGNMGNPNGITLVPIPDTLVKARVLKNSETVFELSSGASANPAEQAKGFIASAVDDNNTKWFLSENGLVSYDDKTWTIHNNNPKIQSRELHNIAYRSSEKGNELWIAGSEGVDVAAAPVNESSDVRRYNTRNSTILSDTVNIITAGKNLCWFGTDKGISGLKDNKWLDYSYTDQYPLNFFEIFRVTSMAASPGGDSIYAGTTGAGVIRLYRNDVDGISGASEYAEWGPIIMPSNYVYSVYVAPDGTQWFGTDMGLARHKGNNTLEGWSVFNTANGLVDNFVQAIHSDKSGNIWIGTKGGVSVFDGSKWTSYTMEDGLISNNVLTIRVDKKDVVWFGTDNGVCSFSDGKFVSYN